MQAQLRYRMPAKLKEQAEKILENIGCDPANAVAMFYARIIAIGGLPFQPTEFPVLEEYGATVAEATAAAEAVVRDYKQNPADWVEFTGKL